MTYKAIIADDEKELRRYLKTMLAETWPDLEICGEAANGNEVLKLIDACQPQIAFLDIKMPGLSGLDVAKKIAASAILFSSRLMIIMRSMLLRVKQ